MIFVEHCVWIWNSCIIRWCTILELFKFFVVCFVYNFQFLKFLLTVEIQNGFFRLIPYIAFNKTSNVYILTFFRIEQNGMGWEIFLPLNDHLKRVARLSDCLLSLPRDVEKILRPNLKGTTRIHDILHTGCEILTAWQLAINKACVTLLPPRISDVLFSLSSSLSSFFFVSNSALFKFFRNKQLYYATFIHIYK